MNRALALKCLSRLPAATVYEAGGKRGDMAPAIRQMVQGTRLFGPAFTVRCLPGDFAAVLRAVDRAKKGDVLVIDAPPRRTAWPARCSTPRAGTWTRFAP
jgi:4-hydroxy-4-methyl-2-oxoglutarate aldolase